MIRKIAEKPPTTLWVAWQFAIAIACALIGFINHYTITVFIGGLCLGFAVASLGEWLDYRIAALS